ncbi:MAG: tRNA pseudouridine(13) synthase TruD [Desulfobacteraceae bacterium]|nr:MAG: tRNA pseudouridine(13) synthase TruD [Desulfobacteraceae bacterium]
MPSETFYEPVNDDKDLIDHTQVPEHHYEISKTDFSSCILPPSSFTRRPMDIAEELKHAMQHLPFITGELPGVGGAIKVSPDHFEVEEILPYAPCGEGEHVFITLRRKLWNTDEVAGELRRCFGLKSIDIGWGGRKDKHALTTQTFSLLLPLSVTIAEIRSRLAGLPFEILDVARHRNKIKTGHVAGNRFRILLSQVPPQRLAQARAICDALGRSGLPNFFGEQRFGIDMNNIERAVQFLDRQRAARGKKEAFIVSVLQSALFNLWLRERMARGEYRTILSGDVVQKTDTGGLFIVRDVDEAAERFSRGAIVYTGPIYGVKMMCAEALAAEYENRTLDAVGLDLDAFKRLKSPGTRRRALLHIEDLTIECAPGGLLFSFSLPSGAYATMVMREFMRAP